MLAHFDCSIEVLSVSFFLCNKLFITFSFHCNLTLFTFSGPLCYPPHDGSTAAISPGLLTLVALQWGGESTGPCVLNSLHRMAGWSRCPGCCEFLLPPFTDGVIGSPLMPWFVSRMAHARDITDVTFAVVAGVLSLLPHPLTLRSPQGGIAIAAWTRLARPPRGGYPGRRQPGSSNMYTHINSPLLDS